MYVSKKSKCVSNKSIFPKYISDETKASSNRINYNTIILMFFLF